MVLTIVIVAQLALLAYLGQVGGGPNNVQNCQVNIWFIHLLCTSSSTPNSNAATIQQLLQLLTPAFIVMDVALVIVFGVVAIRTSGTGSTSSSGGRSRQLRGRNW